MNYKLNLAMDTDGIIFNLFTFQLEKGFRKFCKIDESIVINGKTFAELNSLGSKEKVEFLSEYAIAYSEKTGDLIDIAKYDIHDIFALQPTLLEKKYGEYLAGKNQTNEEESIEQITDKIRLRRQMFWILYIYKYCTQSDFIDGVVEFINKWKTEEYEVGNITARVFVTEQNIFGALFRHILEMSYKKAGINFDYIDYCSEKDSPFEKKMACNKRFVDVMIEDKLDNALAISELGFTKVALLNTPYNIGDINENIIRFDDFSQIDEYIQSLSKEREIQLKDKNYIMDGQPVSLSKDELSAMSKTDLWNYRKQVKSYYKEKDFNQEQYKSVYDISKINKHERIYKTAYPFVQTGFNLAFNPKVINKDYIPYQKGSIFIANHLTYYDQFLLTAALGNRPVHFLTAKKLRDMMRGFFYEQIGCMFVDNTPTHDSSKLFAQELIYHLLANGKDVVIFPEGSRNDERYNRFMLPFHRGAVKAAQLTGAPIVPLAINKNYKFRSKNLLVRVAKPVIVKPDDDIKLVNKNLENIVASMIHENSEYEKEIVRVKKFTSL